MKKHNLTTGVLAALLLASPIAGAETEYPAADFQPKVLYKDTEYKHTKSATSSASAEKSKPAAAETAQPDPNYPAATFKPEVVYKDTEYKHTKSAPASKSASSKAVSTDDAKSTGAAATTEKKEEQSMTNYLLVLGAFAVAGLFFFGRKPQAQAERVSPVYSRDPSGLTGVDRYLKEQEAASATGVTKYLEKQTVSEEEVETASASATGVAKYLEQKKEEGVTGVEKYLRQQG